MNNDTSYHPNCWEGNYPCGHCAVCNWSEEDDFDSGGWCATHHTNHSHN